MRLSELQSESSLMACFRLQTGFAFAAGALFSVSESLKSNDGTFLVVVLEEGLGLERASKIEGCFASRRNNQNQ